MSTCVSGVSPGAVDLISDKICGQLTARLADAQNFCRFMCANQFVGRHRQFPAVKRVDKFKERLKFIGYRLKFLRPADKFFQRVQIQCVQFSTTST